MINNESGHNQLTEQEALVYSYSLLEAALEATTDAILIVDNNGKIVRFNQHFVTLWQIPEEILAERDDQKAIKTVLAQLKDPDYFLKTTQAVYEDKNKHFHDKLYFKDGKVVERFCRPQKIEGITVGRVWTFRDITDIFKRETELRETNERYIDVFKNMYDAIVIIGPDGKIMDCNRSAEQLLGYSRKELNQLHIPDIVYEDDKTKSKTYLKKLEEEGFYSNYEGRIVRGDGQVRYVQVNSNAIYQNGKIIGSRDIVRDITELKEASENKERFLKELAKTNKELEKVVQELKNFAHAASHDLKEPLRTIHSFSQLLKRFYADNLGKDGNEYLDFILDATNRMHNLITDLLSYATTGENLKEPELTDLNALVDLVKNNLQIAIIESKATIEYETLPTIYAYPTLITQLFQNMIANSIKFKKKDVPIIIQIKAEERADEWLFELKDNGIGISKEYHQKVFQIFKKLHSNKIYKGSGIGLATCKKIVMEHGGTIKVESEKGKGATFYFSIKKNLGIIEEE